VHRRCIGAGSVVAAQLCACARACRHHLKPRGAIAFFSAWDRTVNARRSALGL
jgi:hypothetical protein